MSKNNNRPKTCVIYCRVSTTKQAQEGESLDKQALVCRNFAQKNELKVIGKPFRDAFSGRQDHRPKLDEMLGFLFRNKGKIGYVVMLDIGRLTRGGTSSYNKITEEIRGLGVELKDTTGIIQEEENAMAEYGAFTEEYGFAKRRSSKIPEQLMSEVKRDQIDDQLIRLLSRQIDLTKAGYWIGMYPDGFITKKQRETDGTGTKRTILIPDDERAKYILEVFRLRAEGVFTDKEIIKKINQMGYKSAKRIKRDKNKVHAIGTMGERPFDKQKLDKIVCNPTYAGIICKKWTNNLPIKAQFDGLVDLTTWNKANHGKHYLKLNDGGSYEMLKDFDEKKRYKTKVSDVYPYKHVIKCSICNNPFWASASQGKSGKKFPAYHCSGGRFGKPKHKHYGVPQEEFNEIIESFVRGLKFTDEYREGFKLVLKDVYQKQHKEQVGVSKQKAKEVGEMRIRLETIYKKLERATTDILERKLEGDIQTLDEEIKTAEGKRNQSEATEHDFASYLKHAEYLLEHPGEILLKTRPKAEQQAIWSLVFEELPTYEEIKTGTPKLSLCFKLKNTPKGASSPVVRDERLETYSFSTPFGHILPSVESVTKALQVSGLHIKYCQQKADSILYCAR